MSALLSRLAASSTAAILLQARKMPRIQLTQHEDALCQLLDQTCRYIHDVKPDIPGVDSTQQSPDASQRCEARIAGGWVRDKLLSKDSDDLDISVSTLTGNAFALYLQHYLSSEEFASSSLAASPIFASQKTGITKIGKIEANPEQSKNLETATAVVLGLSMDFVNLRKESYDAGSRIPTMTFGTPQEDAERRDITINSMLYNVHTRSLEDHTGLGLKDLAAGLIRTPLPPLTTFLDDPLRVLRCVRFASRFAYELHPTIVRCLTGRVIEGTGAAVDDVALSDLAARDDPRVAAGSKGLEAGRDEIRNALLTKVSRERFGIEVDKMIKGPNPLLALFLIHRLELFPLIFHPPPTAGQIFAGSPAGPDSPTGEPAPDAVALNAARLLDAVLKRQTLEQFAAQQHVSIDGLRLSSADADVEVAQTESEAAKSATRAFSALPTSPIPQTVFDALPQDLLQSWDASALSSEEKRRLWISVSLLPLRGLQYEERKNKYAWAGESVIANGLKLGTKSLKEPVAHLDRATYILRSPARLLQETQEGQAAAQEFVAIPAGVNVKARLGLVLRSNSIIHSPLQLRLPPALLLSFITELVGLWSGSPRGFDPDTSSLAAVEAEAVALARDYASFWATVRQWKLDERAEEKPLLDGNAITATLQCYPRLISRVQTAVLAYQFEHLSELPSATDRPAAAEEEVAKCAAWLRAEWEAGRIVPFDERPPPLPAASGSGKAKKAKKPQEAPDRRKRQKSE
ncbi:related to tRNA nucleotidyltransferase [Pseudozyma flocculosa]|uniref:Related to tRNA nucleotidyltransferase n=1 Tax=Pseudozyma flocculosa TaxID=84751 RepID=A0A5C3FAQ3_9BASI|nr:related to tRNA nucleotidyltransferase [Pseudozyma flocculosa]